MRTYKLLPILAIALLISMFSSQAGATNSNGCTTCNSTNVSDNFNHNTINSNSNNNFHNTNNGLINNAPINVGPINVPINSNNTTNSGVLNSGTINAAANNNGQINSGPVNNGQINTGPAINNGTVNNNSGPVNNGNINNGTINGNINNGTINNGNNGTITNAPVASSTTGPINNSPTISPTITNAPVSNTSSSSTTGPITNNNNPTANASASTGPITNSPTNNTSSSVTNAPVSTTGDVAVNEGDVTLNDGDVTINYPQQRDLTTTRIDAKGYRGFATAGPVPIPEQGPAYFGTTTPGPQFQTMKTILIYKDSFTVDEIKRLAKGCDVDVAANPLIPEPDDDKLANSIKVYIDKPAEASTLVGYVTLKVADKDDVSVDALAKAMLKAREMGGNAVHVTAEGVKRKLESIGWGIGLASTVSTISNSEQTGTVSSGGFGISGGSAGYVDYPWLQIFVLQVQTVK